MFYLSNLPLKFIECNKQHFDLTYWSVCGIETNRYYLISLKYKNDLNCSIRINKKEKTIYLRFLENSHLAFWFVTFIFQQLNTNGYTPVNYFAF